MLPCRRFADVLADACARLGADVDRYSFIEVDLHHKLLAGLPAHSLALRPAHSRGHLYVTSYPEGFSHFVTSMTAPVASGWSVWPGGACTHWKAPPSHGAHVKRPLQGRLGHSDADAELGLRAPGPRSAPAEAGHVRSDRYRVVGRSRVACGD